MTQVRLATMVLALFCTIGLNLEALAFEVVKAPAITDANDSGEQLNYDILQAVLEATVDEFGPFSLERAQRGMVSRRLLLALIKGESLTVAVSTYKASWAGKTLVVPFPVNKGLSSYRMFFARKDSLASLAKVESVAQLKAFRFGQGRGWSTAKTLEDNGFTVVYSDSYLAFSKMLSANRFDLFMRDPQEIVWERENVERDKGLTVVDSIAIYTYLPTYFNVSKTRPELALRLEKGLKKLDAAGEIDRLLVKHFQEAIDLINNSSRRVFYLENTNLPPEVIERDKKYLYNTPALIKPE
ncbi:ABC-type amino acid transport/signal transduction systems, periplasmic component/domain [Alteromonadaceae bacterium Bs31]|nr:ABC-type amino acid transport/signal transduction systems, periplasmic component/domain [Alteromonadaceae bacterium Bs31]